MTVLSGSGEPSLRALFADDTAERARRQLTIDGHGFYGTRSQCSGDSHTTFDPHWDSVPPLWSGGQTDRPDYALVFINPTARNQAARLGWPDEYRAPHIGARRMWRFFAQCELLSWDDVLAMPRDGNWGYDDAVRIYRAASDSGIYVTNLVKACGLTGQMPTAQFAREYLGLLAAELNIIRPRYVVAMGGLVTSLLYGRPFQMEDAYRYLRTEKSPLTMIQRAVSSQITLDSHDTAGIVPCYFPCGRGNPNRAREILTALCWQAEA